MKRVRTGSGVFTLVEILIVLAIVGIVGNLAPALLHAVDQASRQEVEDPGAGDSARQKRTISDIRNTGTAMLSWLTDRVSAAAAGQTMTHVDLRDYPPIEARDLEAILVPNYIRELPTLDGWENRYDYFLNVEQPVERNVMAIRSPGRDGLTEAYTYTVTAFDPSDYDQDVVWADGFFVRWPQRYGRSDA